MAVFVVVVVAAAAATLVVNGELWAAPLTPLLYSLDLGFIVVVAVAFGTSIVLGTPGCEIAALGELIRRSRGDIDDPQEVMWCVGGLDRIDTWEARRRRACQR